MVGNWDRYTAVLLEMMVLALEQERDTVAFELVVGLVVELDKVVFVVVYKVEVEERVPLVEVAEYTAVVVACIKLAGR
jgi:hypothetical protein